MVGTTKDQPAGVAGDPGGAPFSIFISYARGDDDGSARAVNKRLREAFPDDAVYFDVAEPSGTKWDEQLTQRLRDATVFLALVGPNWTSKLRPPRDSADVSMWTEVVFALQARKAVVLPVLVSTPVPDGVPRPLQGLFNRNCAELRHGPSFDEDLEQLVARLEEIRSGETPVEVLEPRRGTADHPPPPWDEPEPSGEQLLGQLDEELGQMASALLGWPVVTVLGPGARGAPPETELLLEVLSEDPDVRAQIEKIGQGADLAEIAQRAWQIGELRVHRAIEKVIATHSQPTDVHRFLAGLPRLMRWAQGEPRHQLIVTTNCENALEQAFIQADEPYDQVVYVPEFKRFVHIPWPEEGGDPEPRLIDDPGEYQGLRLDDNYGLALTTIVKLHGDAARQFRRIRWRLDYVVTEDHYIDYHPARLPQQVLELLSASHVLFLGYRLREWSARVPLRRIWRDKLANESWAVAADLDDFDRKAWEAFGITRVQAEPSELVRALYSRIESRHTETVPG
jgi:SIR2-like domain/TIR domain